MLLFDPPADQTRGDAACPLLMLWTFLHRRGRGLLRDAIAIGVVLCAVAPPGAVAQDWPTRPMTGM
jgi:hypothetical protein